MADLTAVLVDGDNIAADHEPQIMKIAGKAAVARVYLNARLPGGWLARPKFEPRDAGEGKNAADVLLAIEAMDLLQTGRYGRFVIVTSDGDFRHIARRLRLGGAEAVGVGEAKTPAGFRDACTEFKVLPNGVTIPDAAPGANLALIIKKTIQSHSQGGKGVACARLGTLLYQHHGLRVKEQGYKTWRAYFLAHPTLFALDGSGQDKMVRYLPNGFKPTLAAE